MQPKEIQRIKKSVHLTEITPGEARIWKRIKKSVDDGHDVEIRKAPDGSIKVLEVSKKHIPVE